MIALSNPVRPRRRSSTTCWNTTTFRRWQEVRRGKASPGGGVGDRQRLRGYVVELKTLRPDGTIGEPVADVDETEAADAGRLPSSPIDEPTTDAARL